MNDTFLCYAQSDDFATEYDNYCEALWELSQEHIAEDYDRANPGD